MKETIITVDAYITSFPYNTQKILQIIRNLIITQAPGVTETIAFGMPAYKTHNKPLVYFAAYEKHIGFYATPTGHKPFVEELSHYKQGKGSIQFLLNTAIPIDLMTRIINFRVQENQTILIKF
ncbi:iron chaperone [Mariniflexile sp. AS56]|uniref:iron chaperone n=1 Tax=Mariniflexile sp. AS56 TaxID=3063957 RepID=UPI0026EEB9A3|nr:DUF1801 domain-containing protein [Mariniflexile sp. AS56]MDO7173404.1 DUF1801 domain-containing protein [Mariniflexile sp. AS56]